ncbi:hypothetical protein SteCoe_12939 [Stentor coeruleus]|uniref:CRAL-TRIO domain-containing protein n=1 Tax=Stentor coeruleus TaxID=5963 RepID=A0A1R2C9M3_9CILI|nr:hypothetical protein SteCoe_12939 [Stentor coeruleus]
MIGHSLDEGIIVSKLPPEAYIFDPPEDIILSPGKKIPLRNIFSYQDYSYKEKNKLDKLKNQITKANISLPPSYDDAELLRILHGSECRITTAFNDLKSSIAVFNEIIPTDYKALFPKIYTMLNEGFLYIHGRDRYFRPLIVLDVPKIDMKKHSVQDYMDLTIFTMQFVKEHMLIPGKVENWVNIVEMGKLGIRDIPFKPMVKLLGTLQKIFKCRLAHSFVLNPPSSIYYMWTCVKPFIDKATQEKVVFENKGYSETMLNMCALDQIEKRFGGKAPNATTFWPPNFPDIFVTANSICDSESVRKKSFASDDATPTLHRHKISDKYKIVIEQVSDPSVYSDAKSENNENDDFILGQELEKIDKVSGQSCDNKLCFEEGKQEIDDIDLCEIRTKKVLNIIKDQRRKRSISVSEEFYFDEKEKTLDIGSVINKTDVVTAETHENGCKEFNCGCNLNGCFIF